VFGFMQDAFIELPAVRDFRGALRTAISNRFEHLPSAVWIAGVLDPRSKYVLDHQFFGFTEMERARAYACLADWLDSEAAEPEDALAQPPGADARPPPAFARLPEHAPRRQRPGEVALGAALRGLDDEIRLRIAEQGVPVAAHIAAHRAWREQDFRVSFVECPLVWWQHSAPIYPIIARAARVFLAVPATSAPSERVFSTVSRVCDPSRSSLTPERMSALVRLHENQRRRAPVRAVVQEFNILLVEPPLEEE
jgi:hypothetical protein